VPALLASIPGALQVPFLTLSPESVMPRTRNAHKRRVRFDAEYYRRFYFDAATRAVSPAAAKRQAAFISAYLRYLEIPVRRVLDLGCGIGRTLRALQHAFPRANCQGVEYSPYLCKRYGWTPGSAVDFASATAFDLVICNDVLPSLDDRLCEQAITNIARLSRGAAFLGILAEEDWARCDQARTDRNVNLRPARWYRRRLARHFVNLGGGMYLKRPSDITIWALDHLE
jgi:SAM-dependent methyltransferase